MKKYCNLSDFLRYSIKKTIIYKIQYKGFKMLEMSITITSIIILSIMAADITNTTSRKWGENPRNFF